MHVKKGRQLICKKLPIPCLRYHALANPFARSTSAANPQSHSLPKQRNGHPPETKNPPNRQPTPRVPATPNTGAGGFAPAPPPPPSLERPRLTALRRQRRVA